MKRQGGGKRGAASDGSQGRRRELEYDGDRVHEK